MDDIRQVWNELQRKEDALKWGGHPPGLGVQYDSLGRPAGTGFDGHGGWLHEQMGRLERVRRAVDDSGALAQGLVARTLAGIDLAPVRHVLTLACQDIALFYGGSVATGGLVGCVGGAFIGGVGTGAAAGGHVGGGWVMALLGLRSLADGQVHAVAGALHHHEMGFLEAWGPVHQDDWHRPGMTVRGDPSVAAFHLANGHALLIPAMLAALVASLVNSKGGRTALLAEIRLSPRLGPMVAAWVAENEAALCRHPALRTRGWGAAADDESAPMRRPRPSAAGAFGNSSDKSLADPLEGVAPSEQELADMDRKVAAGMDDNLASAERFASTSKDPRPWATIASGGQLSPNPNGPDYPPGVLDDGEEYTKHLYTEGNRSFPVVQTARGVYSYPSASGDSAIPKVIVSGKEARSALLAADAAAKDAELAAINADLRTYNAQAIADAIESHGGWADSSQPEERLIDFRQKVADNVAVVNNLFSADGWSGIGAMLKDGLRNSGGINGPGFDVGRAPLISATENQQSAAVDTLLSVPAFFEHELALSSVAAPVSVNGAGGALSSRTGMATGIAEFDQPFSQSGQASKMLNALKRRGVTVIDDASRLPANTSAQVFRENGKLTLVYDSKSTSFIDMLHESRHVAQVQRAEASGLLGNKDIFGNSRLIGAAERGAYEYEIRLGQSRGFSSEYMNYLNSQKDFYYPPYLTKKFNASPTMGNIFKSMEPGLKP